MFAWISIFDTFDRQLTFSWFPPLALSSVQLATHHLAATPRPAACPLATAMASMAASTCKREPRQLQLQCPRSHGGRYHWKLVGQWIRSRCADKALIGPAVSLGSLVSKQARMECYDGARLAFLIGGAASRPMVSMGQVRRPGGGSRCQSCRQA